MAVRPPDRLPERFGRYRIVKLLGQGGMGSVYLAQDTELGRQVALKVPLLPDGDRSPLLERFYREARAAATLHHPNICPVFDIGDVEGVPFLTMAYIEGKTLSHVVARKSLTQGQAAALVRKLALALQGAHQGGVIHRDLKPANIMIDRRGEPIVMDFGLARRTDHRDTRLTQSGTLIGTPAYMSPEQISAAAETMGPACDIYSLGVILYELLTGRLPFTGGDALAMLACILTEQPPPPSALNPEIDPVLEAICLKAIAKRPEERFASMADLATALRDHLRGDVAAQRATAPVTRDETAPAAPGFRATYMGGLRSVAQLPPRQPYGANTESPRSAPKRRKARRKGPVRPLWPWAVAASCAAVALGGWLLVSRVGRQFDPSGQGPAPASSLEEARRQAAAIPAADGKAVPPGQGGGESKAQAPENGWVRLFNGKDLTGWKVYPEGTGTWKVEGGVLVGSGPRSHLFSERGDYRDFHFRVECKINAKGNSGQYFRAQFGPDLPRGYEAQINAAHGDSVKTGSLYPDVREPDLRGVKEIVVLEAPHGPDEWFTQEVICQGPKITILVNGKKTVEWTDPKYRFKQGHLALQQHNPGSVVQFRKVEIRDLGAGASKAGAPADSFVPLFNGKDLTGWETHPDQPGGWEVTADGLLTGRSASRHHLFSVRGDYQDFHLRAEVRTTPSGNSGIYCRCRFGFSRGNYPDGYEAQILNRYPKPDVPLTGSLVRFHNVMRPMAGPGEWTTLDVVLRGNRIVIKVNGQIATDHLDQANTYRKGRLALQAMTDKVVSTPTTVYFRRIEIREFSLGQPD